MELKNCDLRYCTFHYKGKCCNKKREECPYGRMLDAAELTWDGEECELADDIYPEDSRE